MPRPTLANLQFLRFIAAAAVLFSHSADLLVPHASVVWKVPWTAGVDLFFVISGFIMVWLTSGQFGVRGAAGRYLLRRMIRIVPPYWFFTLAMIATALVAGEHVRNQRLGAAQLVTSFLFVPWPRGDGALNPILSQGWTLNYEAFFYLCFAAAMMSRRGLAWLAAAFVALAAAQPLVPEGWFVLRFYCSPIILEFLGGMGLARLHMAGLRMPRWGMVLGAAVAVPLYLALGGIGVTERAFAWGLPALVFAAGFLLSREPARLGAPGRLLKLGGDASYTLYLSHTFCVNAVVLAWQTLALPFPWLAVVSAMLAAFAFAVLFYLAVERPVTRALGEVAHARVSRGLADVAP